MSLQQACIIGHDDPVEAQQGYLCLDHWSRLRSSLLELPAIVTWLEVFIAAGGNPGAEKVGGTRDDPMPLRADVTDLVGPVARDSYQAIVRAGVLTRHAGDQLGDPSVFDELRSWAVFVHEESGFPYPTGSAVTFDGSVIGEYADERDADEDCRHERWLRRRHDDPRRWRVEPVSARAGWPSQANVKSLADYLAAHLSWVAAQPWVDEFAGKITELSRRAHRLAPWRPEIRRDRDPCTLCGRAAVVLHIAAGESRCEKKAGGCGRRQPLSEYVLAAVLPASRRSA